MLTIDGRMGEGGGQVLRTSLSLSALTGRPFRLTHIRGNRRKPGLRPQHLTAVRAVARICGAVVSGDYLDSATLEFTPAMPPQPGHYEFDVADAAAGGSAGSVMLVLQAVLWPLLYAAGPSHLSLRGGTHVPMSPPFHYIKHVARLLFAAMGVSVTLEVSQWGWYPVGGGHVTAGIEPVARLVAPVLAPVAAAPIDGIAAVTNLPADIAQRMAGRAANLLAAAGLSAKIEPRRGKGPGPGAGIFLWRPQAGFSALGRKGLPSDKVAEAAVAELFAFMDNRVAVDRYLADQLLLPLALAHGDTCFTTDQLTQHTTTNAELVQRWLDMDIDITGEIGHPAEIRVRGSGFTPA